ncbi:MAG TPA: exodeoxyribonuclease VII small subunit [Gammaproteobacteria bacterium]|nr:exodeoxyribonuclease VII small subunit [Gammaproteobacteria bacterium]
MPKKPELPNLEISLTEIAALIEKMEQGDLTLEQSLDQFERGMTLIKHAHKILQEAELKVQILMQNNNQESLGSFENNNNDTD